MMFRRWLFFLGTVLLLSVTITAQAQPLACPALVEQALTALGENCDELGRNSACYGYDLVTASFAEDVPVDFFTQPSDRSDLVSIQSLRTAALDLDMERWGVALVNAQANVPNTIPGQAVTFILLGDTTVENQVEPAEAAQAVDPVSVRLSTTSNVNVRSGPGTNFNAIELAVPNTDYFVDGQDADGGWLRINVDDTVGWVSSGLIAGDADAISALPVVSDGDEGALSPMQAFYFSTGIGASRCEEAPDALIIQGPQDVEVALNVNGLDITIGSTVVLTSVDPSGTASPAAASAPIESPFGADSATFVLDAGVFVYPNGNDTVIIAPGDAPSAPGLALSQGVFVSSAAEGLLITTGLDDTAGIDNSGGLYVNANPAQIIANQPIASVSGTVLSGRVYLEGLPDGRVVLAIEDTTIDPDGVAALLGASLSDGAIAPEQPIVAGCRTTQITVLDGEARLNDGDITLPVGNRAQTETCFADDGAVEPPTEWEDVGVVPQEELAVFESVERVPEVVVRYPIRIPSEEDIRRAVRTPTPLPLPTIDPGEVTIPTITPEIIAGIDCSVFRGTSPTEGMAFGQEQFYWDPAPGADFYRVVVNATDRPGQVIADVSAPTTNLFIDLGIGALDQFGRGTNFQWRVQAWKDNAIACETDPIFQLRVLVTAEEVCMLLRGQWDIDTCYGQFGPIFIPD